MTTAEQQRDLQPLVSIVVDNFNYGRFLRAAIDSAIEQTYAPVEVIVVDDGSTDNSREVISAYGDRVSAIFKPNGGHASAFNAGFRASHGSIVMFLDADDVLLPSAVEEVVRAWHPAVAKAQFVLAHIDKQGRALGGTVPYSPAQMPDGDIRASILDAGGYIGVPTSGNAFARTVLDRLLPLPESQWRQAADTSLEIIAPFLGEVVSLRKTLGCYRIHESNHGMLGEELDSRKLRVKIVIDLQREWALSEFASRSGFTIPRNWAAREPAHLKYRLASLRLDSTHHPITDDRPTRLMFMGLKSAWRNPGYNLRSRLFHTAWFPLAALLPQAIAVKILRRGLLPRRRRGKFPAEDLTPSTLGGDGLPPAPVPRPDGDHRKASA
ncbi:glycosyltransferase family 2 protein [Candidatus Binatus sp.]|uniref:glycosyltransferase family 2 protein n=1 Tax=Candidatus Binatus sp. TaxID=2811406 RepID=UPI003C53CE5C